MKELKDVRNYELIEVEDLPEVNGKGYVLSHIKTKARVLVVCNDDRNKVFTIGFRTPPSDSTGVPHIIEHTVLCGSKKYPVKDPFVELCKGSLNTFLNAMTYPDKTVYPVASCNDKDFCNLVDVYMDAVFNPNIYIYEEIFKQEGWHYELTEKEGPLTINGVVYNEMKGVFSSPDSQVSATMTSELFPHTCYSYESGGDPEVIPSLTREAYLDFHRKYYHPSNSYIYLYGDMDFTEMLEKIDEEYLSGYEYQKVDSEIKDEAPFEKPVHIRKEYSLAECDELEDNTYLSYGVVYGDTTDKEFTAAVEILDYALRSPLKKALIDAGICMDVDSSFDTDLKQPVFSITAYNSNEDSMEDFIWIIDATLKNIIDNGIDERLLLGAINHFEFKHKEANFGRYSQGLIKGLNAFSVWIYDDSKALSEFSMNEVYDNLKKKVGTGYFEDLIKKVILNNNHKVYLTYVPSYGLNAKMEEELSSSLEAYRKSLSDEEREKLIDDTFHLKKYQTEPSSAEDLLKIPMIEISDIDKETIKPVNDIKNIGGTKVVAHDLFTNGIVYIDLCFDISDFTYDQYKTVALIGEILKYIDTDSHSYIELAKELDLKTGRVSFSGANLRNAKTHKAQSYFSIKAKFLEGSVQDTFDLIEEILFTSHITDRKRLKEIIAETKSSIKASLLQSGHMVTAHRALSYIDELDYIKEIAGGITYYRYIDMLDKNFDNMYDQICDELNETLNHILRKDALVVSVTTDKNVEDMLLEPLSRFTEKLSDTPMGEDKNEFKPHIINEGFKAASQVQYVATAGNFRQKGFKYDAALQVLQMIFAYDYLWLNVRVKGGAYGSMCSFTKSGYSYFTSYRDPNLMETYDIYKEAYKYVEEFDCDDRDMNKYIIGVIAKLDHPMTASALGEFSFVLYLSEGDVKNIQKERDRILSTTQEDIRKLAPIVKAITDSGIICAIGNEEKIENSRQSFLTVEGLN